MHRWSNKKDMAGDDPPYLSVGTEVSAKYKGAFCEAKIRKVVKSVKCKVQYKNEQGSVFVNDDQIKGLLMSGASVEVKQTDKKDIEGTIVKIQDLSQYTVVFDDGDIATLRRTALCLKSGRHFAESETLDQLPLTHPEHFSTPVVSGARGSRRRDDMDENSDDEEKQAKVEREEDMGKVVCVEVGDKKKSKDNWFPGLIVAPNAQDSVKIDVEDEYLVRSFKDGRYYTVPKSETGEFTREMGFKIENATLKQAVEKAILFLDKSELPPHWDRDQLFGMADFPSDIDASDTDSMDDEPREEKDHFVAQLYKFMDDRGTPINKGPMISGKDVDLYRLFKIVYKLGGYNRVTNRNQWKSVAMKSGYSISQTNNVKSSYKKYLHSFEDFYRKLGCTLLTTSRDNKLRSRSSRPLIRDRDKAAPEKLLVKDDISSSSNEDVVYDVNQAAAKEATDCVKGKLIDVQSSKDDGSVGQKSSEVKKENTTITTKIKREPETKDKFSDNNTTKDAGIVQLAINKDIKEEKMAERKSAKPVTKPEEAGEKKMNRFSLKTKTKKTKPVEKRIKKTERVLIQMKEKRSLKERMKAIVHKLKLSSANSSEHQDKKKQKTTEELNKLLSPGTRIKLKDELIMNPKTRKLSVGSGDSKSSGSGQNDDKKFGGSSNSINSLAESTSSSSGPTSKLKKNEEDGSETSKKKSSTRKRREDADRFATVSTEVVLNQAIEFLPPYKSICIGDKLKVYYEPTHESKVTYEAKVTNKRFDVVTEYLVHYTGWNTRYDEWIRRSRIADNLSWTPSRSKRKPNQHDNPATSQTQTAPAEQSPQPNQNNGKPDRLKRSSTSPVAKNRSKLSIKGGMKQMRNIKNKLESKSKKSAAQKDSDSGSQSEGETSKKQVLQKTRSLTEKRKQKGEEPSPVVEESNKDTKTNKKTTPLKRTRSGSIKLEGKETLKKRKLSPSVSGKSNKTNTIRNSIMKSLVPRKRVNNRTKDSKDEKNHSESSLTTNDMSDDEMEECNEFPVDAPKNLSSNDSEKKKDAENVCKMNDNFVLKLRPLTPEKIANEDVFEDALDTLEPNEKEPAAAAAAAATTTTFNHTINEKETAPVLKREAPVELEVSLPRPVTTPLLPDSYLAENLDSKPKIVKTKLKKEADDKSTSPAKSINRSNEKSTPVKPTAGEIKEKTIFTSRSPCDKKNEKTPEKDSKIRSVSTFSSYLNIEKIDSIKKTSNTDKVEKTENPNVISKPNSDSAKVKCEDDIYEFKEPEPLVIDDRAILHRTFKRAKPAISTVDSIIKEVDEPSQLSEDMNIVETKPISQALDDTREHIQKVNEKVATLNEKKPLETAESCISAHKEEAVDSEEDKLEDDSLKCEMTLEAAKSIVLNNEGTLLVLTSDERLGDSDLEDGGDDDDDDADESKLVILETDSVGELEDDSSRKSSDEAISNLTLVIESVATEKNLTDSQSIVDEKKLLTDASSAKGNRKANSQEEVASVTKESIPKKSALLRDEKLPSKSAAVSSESCEDKAEVCDKVTKKSATESDLPKPKMKSSSKNVVDCVNEDKEKVKPSQPASKSESARHDFVSRDNVVGEVVVDVLNASKKDSKTEKDSAVKLEKMEVDESSKSKDEDTAADNDGLLLCEETIPKSPEAKEVTDTDGEFESASRMLVDENKKKLPSADLTKPKKDHKSAANNVLENSPTLASDGSHSTPAMSPSEEVSGFSSTTFSLNEKLGGSNKDSSENETSSDTSEKRTKVKKYSNEVYTKKNAFEFDTYLKRKADHDTSTKLDDSEKKKTKSNSPSVNGSDKDDFSDTASSPKTAASPTPPKKSVVANILSEIPGNFDSHQRIEFLEQKLQQIRNKYNSLKQEVVCIDKKRKKLKRREREGRMMTRNEANSLL